MRKTVIVLFLLLLALPLPCQAQRFRGIEVFGGYSYLKDNIGSLINPAQNPFVLPSNDVGLNGWQASLTENATNWFGVWPDTVAGDNRDGHR
ncbi:MAG: hypothetical protein P8Z30_17150 [Acidobacteriota bacterium]